MDSVDEFDSLDDAGDDLGAVEEPPPFGGGFHELEDHGEARDPRAAAFRFAVTMADRGKGRFDRIGGAQMNPVLGREVVERQ